jgi:hypothetical protein
MALEGQMLKSEQFVAILEDVDKDVFSRDRRAIVSVTLDGDRAVVRTHPQGHVVGYVASKEILPALRRGAKAFGTLSQSMRDVMLEGIMQG